MLDGESLEPETGSTLLELDVDLGRLEVSKVSAAPAVAGPRLDDSFLSRCSRSSSSRPSLASFSLRKTRVRLASACFRDRATRSLWQAMHQMPCDVFAKMSSSILWLQDLQRKQSPWYDSSPGKKRGASAGGYKKQMSLAHNGPEKLTGDNGLVTNGLVTYTAYV